MTSESNVNGIGVVRVFTLFGDASGGASSGPAGNVPVRLSLGHLGHADISPQISVDKTPKRGAGQLSRQGLNALGPSWSASGGRPGGRAAGGSVDSSLLDGCSGRRRSRR